MRVGLGQLGRQGLVLGDVAAHEVVEVVVVLAQGPGELLHGPDLRGLFQAAVAVHGVLPFDDLGLGDLKIVRQPALALELLQVGHHVLLNLDELDNQFLIRHHAPPVACG